MISINDILIILIFHTIFDWCLQTRWQANNKHKNMEALGEHVDVYTLGLILVSLLMFDNKLLGFVWVGINAFAHFITDLITSRTSNKFKTEGKEWLFIVNVGVDQLIHYVTLFTTLNWMK